MQETPQPDSVPIPQQAAKGSWASGVIAIVLLVAGRGAAPVIVELGALALVVIGIICGVVSLFGLKKHGAGVILGPALLGLALNGFLAFIFVSNFFAARDRAQ